MRKKYILMIVSHGENSLNFIHYFIIFFQCIYSSTNRPFLTKNNYSSQDPLYSFYMKYSVKENRREKILYSKRFIKQGMVLLSWIFPGALSWINIWTNCVLFKSRNRDNQEQKLLRQPHKCPPHPQFNVVSMTEKRKFNPLFPTLIMGAGGRPTYFKMAKNVKSLIIFARDCRLSIFIYIFLIFSAFSHEKTGTRWFGGGAEEGRKPDASEKIEGLVTE